MLSILFNSHSSLLVADGQTAIYTDPFFGRAFSTWLPNPEPYLSSKEVVAELSTYPHAAILISHAHDDHCDREFIEQNSTLTYIIPSYESQSLEQKLRKNGASSIVLLQNDTPTKFGTLEFVSYLYPEISREDATVTISDSKTLVVHANDCWWPISSELAHRIQEFPGEVLFASQINTADSFPMAYECYSDNEANDIKLARIRKHVHAFENNLAIRADMRGFVYAGHVLIDSPINRVREQTVPNFDTVLNLAQDPSQVSSQILKMSPGDCYCDGEITRPASSSTTKNRSPESHYYESLHRMNSESPHRVSSSVVVDLERLSLDVAKYFGAFDDFVAIHSQETGFRPPVGKFLIEARSGDHQLYQSPKPHGLARRCDLSLNLSASVWQQLLSGEIVFDDVYIGSLGWFSKHPRDVHNGDCIRWLSQFGYVWAGKLRRLMTTDNFIPIL